MNDQGLAVAIAPSRLYKFLYRLRRLPSRLAGWLTMRLLALIVWLERGSGYRSHAERELADSVKDGADGPNRWMHESLLQLLAVFAAQGHSGASAAYCVQAFSQLASFQPLGPLTGADDEWIEHSETCFQNKRCSRVFKDSKDGLAYDIDGRVFREPSGACYTNWDSRVPVTFPYYPKTEYVDVPACRD